MTYPIIYSRRVRFSDIDVQGHVFNANYIVYFDDAITDYLEAAALSYPEITARGHDMVLARAECDYRSPGALGETLEVGVGVERVGNTSLVFGIRIQEAEGKRVVAEGKETYVILDCATRRPAAVPDYMKEAIERLQGSADSPSPRGRG